MKPGFYIDYYDDLFILYPDGMVDVWLTSFGWARTTSDNVTGSWKLIELF